jgi:NAD(P)-dependent dehydrogenase (short-subunit alcohol dehydrogenase family)
VTGAASGIGRALARALAAEGCHLALSDVDGEGLARTAESVGGSGAKVRTDRLDVRDREAVHAWADAVAAEFGHVNLIFNNAGVALSADVRSMSYEDLEWVMDVDFWGVVHGTKAFLPHLERSGEGHVVNVSSIFGVIAVPTQSAYNAAKFAVRGFTESLREELELAGSCVSASTVHPGGVKTHIVANARLREVEGRVETREEAMQQFDRLARTTSEEAARAILDGVKRNERRILVGLDARILDGVQRLAPAGYQWLLETLFRRSRASSDR